MRNALRIVFGVLFILTVYLIPIGLAMLRRAPSRGSTAVVNVLLGWTIIGYVIALAMALRSTDG